MNKKLLFPTSSFLVLIVLTFFLQSGQTVLIHYSDTFGHACNSRGMHTGEAIVAKNAEGAVVGRGEISRASPKSSVETTWHPTQTWVNNIECVSYYYYYGYCAQYQDNGYWDYGGYNTYRTTYQCQYSGDIPVSNKISSIKIYEINDSGNDWYAGSSTLFDLVANDWHVKVSSE